MLASFVYVLACRLVELVVLLVRSDRSKELEIVVPRHELSILRRQVARPQLSPCDRLVLAAVSRVLPRSSWHAFFVTPETLLRWHRRIIARRWTYPHRRAGRPPLDQKVCELILRLARENRHWGYVRIAGELRKLGISVSATLVHNVLARADVPPAPRRAQLSWRSFLRQHAATTLACDVFTVDTVFLQRLYVLFFISIGTRRLEYAACTSNPDTAWMTQQARNLLMEFDDREESPLFLIHDRDKRFSRAFDAIFQSNGARLIRSRMRGGGRRRLEARAKYRGVPLHRLWVWDQHQGGASALPDVPEASMGANRQATVLSSYTGGEAVNGRMLWSDGAKDFGSVVTERASDSPCIEVDFSR